MDDGWQPDAIIRLKLDLIKREFFEYIDKNIDKIDKNVPVFYGHVITILEKTIPDISDELHDRFIDSVTVHVLNASKRSDEIPFIEKLFDFAERNKRKKTGNTLYDVMLGMKLINLGKYPDAIEMLKKYRAFDAVVCPAVAYCYYVLSTQQGCATENGDTFQRPKHSILDS